MTEVARTTRAEAGAASARTADTALRASAARDRAWGMGKTLWRRPVTARHARRPKTALSSVRRPWASRGMIATTRRRVLWWATAWTSVAVAARRRTVIVSRPA